MQKKTILLLFFLTTPIIAQNNFGSWNVVNFTVKINPKWNAFAETQVRSLSFYNEFHYYEFKVGATYKLNSNFSLTSGIGSYNTFSEGGNFELPAQNKETRTWFQVNMKNSFGPVTFDHRYRAEQRFTSNGYRNRFRYRLGATIPLNDKKIKPKTFYLSLWNEIFFKDNEPFFERNRFFVGCGYEFSDLIAIQTGYIHQFDYKINDEIGRDFLNIAILYNFNLHREPSNFLPNTND